MAVAVLLLAGAGTAQAGQGSTPARLINASFGQSSVDDMLGTAGIARDRNANLYGTTQSGGRYDKGTVYRLGADGTKTILHSFAGGRLDGAAPMGGVIVDSAGNLYGATSAGGGTGCANAQGCGTIFRISADGTETVVYSFKGGHDGAGPAGNLVLGKAGQLYGTTRDGGSAGRGTVFEISPAGREKIVHAFTPAEGMHATGVLNADALGNLYGSTAGVHETMYRLTPDGTLTILFQFA